MCIYTYIFHPISPVFPCSKPKTFSKNALCERARFSFYFFIFLPTFCAAAMENSFRVCRRCKVAIDAEFGHKYRSVQLHKYFDAVVHHKSGALAQTLARYCLPPRLYQFYEYLRFGRQRGSGDVGMFVQGGGSIGRVVQAWQHTHTHTPKTSTVSGFISPVWAIDRLLQWSSGHYNRF